MTEIDEKMREFGFVGFAHVYLWRCDQDEVRRKYLADIESYKKLMELDSRLGTTRSEQLCSCLAVQKLLLCKTTRPDIIKVKINYLNKK